MKREQYHQDGNSNYNTEGDESRTTLYVKYATWNQTKTTIEYNEPGNSPETEVINDMTTQNLNYQELLSGYTMPFNYLWAMLVVTQDKDFILELADLVYNSDIEITIHDDYSSSSTTSSEKYTVTKNKKNYEYEKKTTITTSRYSQKAELTKANVWIVDYKENFQYQKTDSGSEWVSVGKELKGKDDPNAEEPNFETILKKHGTAKQAFREADTWLFEIMEDENNGISHLIETTEYLLLVQRLGSPEYVDENDRLDFSIYDPHSFKKMSSGLFVGNDLEEKIWFMLKDIDYSDYCAAGVMGNLAAETDAGRSIHNDCIEKKTDEKSTEGEGHGIAQWSYGRRENLIAYAKSIGKDWSDEDVQIEFLRAELNGGGCNGYASSQVYPEVQGYYNQFLAAKSPEEAADYFNYWFERCTTGDESHDRFGVREDGARYYYEKFKGRERPSGFASGGGNQGILQAASQIHDEMVKMKFEYCASFWRPGCCSHPNNGTDIEYSTFAEACNGRRYTNCVAFVTWVLKEAGYPVTGNKCWPAGLQDLGFIQIKNEADLIPGDIVWTKGGQHVEIYAGNNTVYSGGWAPSQQPLGPTPRVHAINPAAWRDPNK